MHHHATRPSRVIGTALFLVGATATVLGAQTAATGATTRSVSTSSAPSTALKQLDPADLAFWKNVRFTQLSNDGKWFAYQLTPNEGDAEVIVRPTGEGEERRFQIGEPPPPAGGFGGGGNTSVVITEDAKWLGFMKYPTAADAKKLRKDRKPVQSGVVLVNLATGEKREFEKVRRFSFAPKQANWVALQRYAAEGAPANAGADMLLVDLRNGAVTSVGNVGEYAFDDAGGWLAWTIEGRDLVGNGVQVRDLRTDVVRVLDSDKSIYRRLTWADSGLALAVLRGRPDSAAADTSFNVLGYTGFGGTVKTALYSPSDTGSFPNGLRITADRAPRWSVDRSAIYFGIAPRRTVAESKTPRPDVRPAAGIPGAMQATGRGANDEDELASLVIWHAKDPRLQSQQQVEEGRDKTYSYLAGYRVNERKFVRLATDDVRDVTLAPNDRWAIGGDVRGYERSGNIDGMRFHDVYVIDPKTGERKLAVKKNPNREFISPDGSKFLYFEDGQYRVYDIAAGTSRVITEGAGVSFVDTEDDHNVDRPPVQPIGWSKDNSAVLLSDNWDIWRVPVAGGKAVNLTGNGRATGIRYQRRVVIDPDERGIDLSKPMYVSTYGERTKKEGLSVVAPGKAGATSLVWEDAKYNFARAKNADTWIFTRQTVKDFPDYWSTTGGFASPRRLTTANPQQTDYAWSSGAQLVNYVSDKGDTLQGALYLPANYEPGKKYPTVVYIYEKRSQFLHSYSQPNETAAFNASVYTSRGYAVFQPDIVYRVNDPGMSAVWCVVPAVKAAIATGIVDSTNIALHGHSWGGYQTAFLVTQTNIFKSAIAGAALTDMVSMYSSIYWNTGTADMAIFESSQGRFKGNFIENYDAYIRNSPAFHADKIKTPLMLLHNERDGAVDFNQGITFFNTLRELGKDVVLLQYVGENHGLAQPRNQKDYTIRMREYFDYYLKGAPAPDWLKDGIPRLKMDEHLKSRQKKTEKIAS
ncbi:MAG TPA: prolyl oligopeptidase family serine peptidase [Gemmatimonadaceae bacterium]|nr:prolyl oligopeptidase family serine peptidase [Gemmatimonadaceae bacterium]